MRKFFSWLGILFSLIMLAGCNQTSSIALNLYTDRHYDVNQTLFESFTESTGIQINVLKMDADALITRLENEGVQSPADLVFLTDVGRLQRAKEKDLLQPFSSLDSVDTIPSKFVDEDNQWVGLTKRARVLVYNANETDVSTLSTYEALSSSSLRIATRSSTHVYNQSLVASLLALNGTESTRAWLNGLVERFAIRDPLTQNRQHVGNDRDQAKAVYAGIADVAIMNTYYMGRMLFSSDPLEVSVAQTLSIFFPNQATTGTHVNISGIGLARHSKNTERGQQFINFLLSESAQRVFADENFEYPIRSDMAPHSVLQTWGSFNEQNLALSTFANDSQEAYTLMVQAGWN